MVLKPGAQSAEPDTIVFRASEPDRIYPTPTHTSNASPAARRSGQAGQIEKIGNSAHRLTTATLQWHIPLSGILVFEAEPSMKHLPAPELVSSYFDDGFSPLLGAMCLRWPEEPEFSRAHLWHFPGGVRLIDLVPEHFGIRILRTADDGYEVSLLWNRTALFWEQARREELLDSSLRAVLACLGTDLGHLLDQPVLQPLKAAA